MVVCMFLRSVERVTNTVRQRRHDTSVAERWTSRDHDLSKTAGRRSALQNLDLV